ncbi:MAG: HPr kinase/phosphorylase [Candidatus Bathyarchaeia archaeon]
MVFRTRYSVQLIDPEEKDELYQQYEDRFLYTAKAGIYGCCIKLLTEVEYVKDRWEDNFYTMSEDVRSHGRLIVLEEPGQQMTVKYDPYTKTAFLVNVDYYGWIKSIALAVAGDILEDEHRIYSVHGAAIDIGGHGVSLIAPSGTGKTTHSWGLLRLKNARLVSDDWYFVRLSSREPLAFGSEKNCYIEADIGKIWNEYERLVDKAHFDKEGRAVVNVRWIVGSGGVIPLTTMRNIILLKRDPTDSKIATDLSTDEALQYMTKNDFCNPHQLVKDRRKLELRKEFFRRYFEQANVYLVNTIASPQETQQKIREILKVSDSL